MKNIVTASLIAILIAACGNNTYKRKPLAPRIVTVPAPESDYEQNNNSDLEDSNPSDEKDYSAVIELILSDDTKSSQLATNIIDQLKTIEPRLDVESQFVDGLVTLVRAKNAKSPNDITDAIFPAIETLFENDSKRDDSPIKELVLNSPDMVKSQVTAKIKQTLDEEST